MKQEPPPNFLDLPSLAEADSEAVILPLPFERTTSYGKGAEGGPDAILRASCQIELFDEELGIDFEASGGFHTAPSVQDDPERSIEQYLKQVAEKVRAIRDKFFLALGGEHTVTYGVVEGLVESLDDLTIVMIDAHADLIDELEGRRWSHGTVARRLWEQGCRVLQIGVRSLSREEHDFIKAGERIETWYAHELSGKWQNLLARLGDLSGPLYLSVDVDGLDPSLIPSTGTPQPEGLTWRQTMDVFGALSKSRAQWLGADVVEFVPSPQSPGCDITAAKLAVKLAAYWRKRNRSSSGL